MSKVTKPKKSLEKSNTLNSNLPSTKEEANGEEEPKKIQLSKSVEDFPTKDTSPLNSYRGSRIFTDFDIEKAGLKKSLVRKIFSSPLSSSKEKDSTEDFNLSWLPPKNDLNQKEDDYKFSGNIEEYDVKLATKFQTFIRSYLTETSISQFNHSSDCQQAQIEALNELIQNEKNYVELLQIIVESYINPLKSMKPPILSSEQISTIFFNYEEIYLYHKSFQILLENKKKTFLLFPTFNISFILFSHFKKILNLYEDFATNFSQSEKSISQTSSKSKTFSKFLEQRSTIYELSFAPPSFRALLAYPSKFLSSYELPCRKLLYNTNNNLTNNNIIINNNITNNNNNITTNYKTLLDSIALISQFAKHIQENIEYNDCQSISALLGNKFELVAPKRQFIRDCALVVNQFKRILLLFSDILIIASKRSRTRLKLEDVFPLKDISIGTIRRTVDMKKVLFPFQINSTKEIFDCEEEAKFETSFTKIFIDQIKLCGDKVFGVPLPDLLQKERTTIPSMIVRVTYFLDKFPNKVGMFRSMGNPSIVSTLRITESTSGKSTDYSVFHRDDVSALLAVFLDLLPSPVINFNLFDPIFTTNPQNLTEIMITNYLEKSIQVMNTQTRNVIEYYAYFLQKLTTSGGPSSSELSLYFAPVIIRTIESTIEYCNAMPVIVRIIDLLIQKCDKLFTINENVRLPSNIEEFLNSDSFGSWWKSFRSKDPKFIDYITSSESVDQLLSQLTSLDNFILNNNNSNNINLRNSGNNIGSNNNDDNNNNNNNNDIVDKDNKDKNDNDNSDNNNSNTDNKIDAQKLQKFGNSTANVLSSESISQILFSKADFLPRFFKLFENSKFEITKKFFCEIIQCFFSQSQSDKIIKYFLDDNNLNDMIIKQLKSGNVSLMITRLTELSTVQHNLRKILCAWGISGLSKFTSILRTQIDDYLNKINENNNENNINNNEDDYEDKDAQLLESLTQFLSDLLHCHDFIYSEDSNQFLKFLFETFEKFDLFGQTKYLPFQSSKYLINIITAIITKKVSINNRKVNSNSNVWVPDNLRDEADKIDNKNDSIDQRKEDLLDKFDPNQSLLADSDEGESKKEKSKSKKKKKKKDKSKDKDNINDNQNNNKNNSNNNNNIIDENNEIKNEEKNNITTTTTTPTTTTAGLTRNTIHYTLLYKTCINNYKEDLYDFPSTFLTALVQHHTLINEVLEKDTPTLGSLKLSVIQLIQALILIHSQAVYDILPKTKIFDGLIGIIERYPLCSIVQCIIRDIFLFIFQTGNENLINHIILETKLISLIITYLDNNIRLSNEKNITASKNKKKKTKKLSSGSKNDLNNINNNTNNNNNNNNSNGGYKNFNIKDSIFCQLEMIHEIIISKQFLVDIIQNSVHKEKWNSITNS